MGSSDKEKRQILDLLVKELQEENLAVFAGAGLSMPAGFVSWKELLRPIADELELDVDKEHDLVSLAQFHINEGQGNRGRLNQLLIDEFNQNAAITENHKVLARLPIPVFWTTNYDDLIERSIEASGKIADVKYTKQHLVYTKRRREAVIYKMHGDARHPDEAVLTKDDYEKYHIDRQPYLDALKGDLISRTFLFLGFSFTDPNLDYILSRVRVAYDNNQRPHYCVLRKVWQCEGQSQADFEYDKRKQELFIGDLKRFGIKTILVDEYSEITDLLLQAERLLSSKTIFVSGAAHIYEPFEEMEVRNHLHELSKSLLDSGYKLVSGFGLGIADAVASGALASIYGRGETLHSNDQFVMRPFPQIVSGGQDLKSLWTQYRHDMIAISGIAVFLFGNKLSDGETISSNGMREEFEIAKEKGVFLLPVGATGYMARELWDEVNADFESYFPKASDDFKRVFCALGQDGQDMEQISKNIIQAVNLLVS